jgi:hypothetical protein
MGYYYIEAPKNQDALLSSTLKMKIDYEIDLHPNNQGF